MRSIWKSLTFQQVVTANVVFRLQYKSTFILLIALSILIACRQYFGVAISCITKDIFPREFLNSYCYTHSTFTTEEAWKQRVGIEVPYPGVGKYLTSETKIFNTYYPWISLVLFLQAVLFLVPRYLWKIVESGRIEDMLSDLKSSPTVDINDKLKFLAEDVTTNFKHNKGYFISCCAVEILSLINIIGQMFWMDDFLNGAYFAYGRSETETFGADTESSLYEMNRYFPRVSKCTLYSYGSSGDVQRNDFICMLPINALNEKIYIFLRFWFFVLALLSSLLVMYRFLILLVPRFRMFILKFHMRRDVENLVKIALEKGDAGDWFIMCLLHKNMKSRYFKYFLSFLAVDRESESTNLYMEALDTDKY